MTIIQHFLIKAEQFILYDFSPNPIKFPDVTVYMREISTTFSLVNTVTYFIEVDQPAVWF